MGLFSGISGDSLQYAEMLSFFIGSDPGRDQRAVTSYTNCSNPLTVSVAVVYAWSFGSYKLDKIRTL